MREDSVWKSCRVSADYLQERSVWLSEQRNLNDRSFIFFRDAGKLLSLSRLDYSISNLAFFLTILGVERALKLHYRDEEQSLKQLLQAAVQERIIRDSMFSRIEPLSKMLSDSVDENPESHSHKLISLIPKLRNTFFHGSYLLSPDFLFLAIQMREIADALHTHELPKRPQVGV